MTTKRERDKVLKAIEKRFGAEAMKNEVWLEALVAHCLQHGIETLGPMP